MYPWFNRWRPALTACAQHGECISRAASEFCDGKVCTYGSEEHNWSVLLTQLNADADIIKP